MLTMDMMLALLVIAAPSPSPSSEAIHSLHKLSGSTSSIAGGDVGLCEGCTAKVASPTPRRRPGDEMMTGGIPTALDPDALVGAATQHHSASVDQSVQRRMILR